jgi:hypothetical protein|tara:strand:+ start:545 stop:811 length:267 start_codon:yes stop_codon:yes gene_type:complete
MSNKDEFWKEKQNEQEIRAFVDLSVNGNATGGTFIKSSLKEHVEMIEKEGVQRVVGVVYDGSYNLEILLKPVEEIEADKTLNQKGVKV